MPGTLIRVKRSMVCPVCGKADWCRVAADGSYVVCNRTSSDRPARGDGAGWIHRLDGPARPRIAGTTSRNRDDDHKLPQHEVDRLARQFFADMSSDRLARLARHLGVFDETLRLLRVGWSHEHAAFSFPMRDALGHVVGIRLRKPDGAKFSVRGGREGLFFSTSPNPLCIDTTVLLVVEGPTDCAAALDLGFECVGRPSCTGAVQLLIDVLVLRRFERVVVVADADGPGWTGADTLARRIVAQRVVRRVSVLPPPDGAKDLRQWKNSSNASHHDLASWVDAPLCRTIKL